MLSPSKKNSSSDLCLKRKFTTPSKHRDEAPLSTPSPKKTKSPTSGSKKVISSIRKHRDGGRSKVTDAKMQKPTHDQSLRRPTSPSGEAWPLHDLRVFDAPTEAVSQINCGPMLREVLESRGWRYSTNPCHGVYDEEKKETTIFVKEFEASLRSEKPVKLFGKEGSVEDGYRLQAVPLPNHALWMMGRLPFRVPGTAREHVRERDDFPRIVAKHGNNLPGKPGNYRIAKFPGTETLCWKTKFSDAFKDKAWYPATYILPEDKAELMKEIRSKGTSKSNLWIGKPRNDYGGTGIRVWHGTDPDLIKVVRESDSAPRSLIQHYLPDPLLIGGYKFHMRIHLLITNVSPLEAYVQENGQCLFSTKPYTLSSKTLGVHFDPPVHVTNMGLNAKPENKENYFRKKPVIGRGQQIRMRQLVTHLSENYPAFNKKDMWRQVLSIAEDTTRYLAHGTQRHMKTVPGRHFELFGMDLMLDKDFKVWMCEVNTDPGLSYPDDKVLGSPNPDYQKEAKACQDTFHDMFAILGLDAGRPQSQGALNHWFKVDFPATNEQA